MKPRGVILVTLSLGLIAGVGVLAGPAFASGPSITQGSVGGPHVNVAQETMRGVAALQAGAYRDAEEAFRHVTEATPSDADAWYNLGQAASALGEKRTAEQAYARSVALDPTSIDSRREFAMALIQIKQPDKATAQLAALKAQAAACKDSCPQAYELRAAISTVQGALPN